MRFVIDRSKWRCGAMEGEEGYISGIGPTCLLNEQGYRCCLGFVSEQMGVPAERLLGCSLPTGLNIEDCGEALFTLMNDRRSPSDTWFQSQAVEINDNPNISNEEREARLTELFKEFGHEIEFVGEYN